ncbi:MAG TPA: integrase arm-type DNA-binding domain-containing protein [Beijerinckiaceae bacterium]|jgi:integrase|nr:integrase arm-type DNA-binding domain-containing protein [Beijerinckiaceae bacterium]
MRAFNRLTPKEIEHKTKPGLYADGGGLYLQVAQGGTKSWLFRFMMDGRARKMGLGAVHTVKLADARKRAADARLMVQDGFDPIDAKKERVLARRLERAKQLSFKECAEKYIAAHQDGWKNAKHREQWGNTLSSYAYPTIGALSVSAIDTALVMKVLEPIWKAKTETASRLRGRIESVLDWASARQYRSGENPARWRGHLENLLPAKAKIAKTEHHAAMAYAALGAFSADLRAKSEISAQALEFTILTAARTGETIGATVSEIDVDRGVWTVPAPRMKARREHRVPLSDRALALIRPLVEGRAAADLIFTNVRTGKGLSNMAMLELLRGMTEQKLTVHGFRSTFMDWGHETTAYPKEMMDIALAHTVSDKVEAAYRRGDMFEKRRRLMADWAQFCAQPRGVGAKGNIVSLRTHHG